MKAAGDMATTARVADAQLGRLIEQGCAVIELDPPEAEAVAEVVSAAASFFRLPAAEKAKSRIGPAAGYRPQGIEYSNSPERPDEMETFSATAASASQGSALPSGSARNLHGRTAVAFQLLEQLAEQLVLALAEHLTRTAWKGALSGGLHRWSCLQVNHSHPSEARSEFINEVHEDGHFLTLAYATSEGLEVRQRDGGFSRITTASNQMVVMLGGIASLMTDGRLPPLFHRVRSMPSCAERTSVLFFADLAPELCQPWIAGETNRSIDIGAYIRANPTRFGLQKYGSE
jgi:isopenicillin N synthase-like dioxygenase